MINYKKLLWFMSINNNDEDKDVRDMNYNINYENSDNNNTLLDNNFSFNPN
jgi:hypothetical protein